MGAWTELVDYTVPSNTTSVTLNSFGEITKNDFYKIVTTFVYASATQDEIFLYFNTNAGVSGATSNSNYHAQVLAGQGTSIIVARVNTANYGFLRGSDTSSSVAYVKVSENGKTNVFATTNYSISSEVRTRFDYATSSNLTFNDPITSITFTANQTNGIGTGSRIQIYRLDAEKVADITTTENATQVDISSLSIGKDDEYLLVSDIINTQNTGAFNELFVNDNTTSTNYYHQIIRGSGSSASAFRTNTARFAYAFENSTRAISHTHIKLSEIGAYTAQSYTLSPATSLVEVRNNFISSTAENITSITKLNIRSSDTNAIGSGSRFILYKLK
jgi:hypothetical protein